MSNLSLVEAPVIYICIRHYISLIYCTIQSLTLTVCRTNVENVSRRLDTVNTEIFNLNIFL